MPALKTVDLVITSLAPSGEGVAHHTEEGARRAVLVHGGAPGDTVRVTLDTKERPARGTVLEVLAPSAERVAPACPHVQACGGCDWMHLSRHAQRQAHVTLAPAASTVHFHAAPSDTAYRTRARLHIAGGRAGYYGARTHTLAAVASCLVLDPRLDGARSELGPLFEGARGHGEAHLALGRTTPVANVRWSGELPAAVYGRLERALGRWQGFAISCGDARRPSVIGDATPWTTGADGVPLELAPGGFAQANPAVNLTLATHVAALAIGEPGLQVLELYAGAGNLSVMLAPKAHLRAVESDEPSCEAARRNLMARGLTARVTCADAASFDLPRADVLVLDPPRTGAREVTARLASQPIIPRVVYVACDRATLARDLDALGAAYEITSVDLFEMFPQTSHVETVVALRRRPRA